MTTDSQGTLIFAESAMQYCLQKLIKRTFFLLILRRLDLNIIIAFMLYNTANMYMKIV